MVFSIRSPFYSVSQPQRAGVTARQQPLTQPGPAITAQNPVDSYAHVYDAGRLTPLGGLHVVSVSEFTTLEHPEFPCHSVRRLKRSHFCNGSGLYRLGRTLVDSQLSRKTSVFGARVNQWPQARAGPNSCTRVAPRSESLALNSAELLLKIPRLGGAFTPAPLHSGTSRADARRHDGRMMFKLLPEPEDGIAFIKSPLLIEYTMGGLSCGPQRVVQSREAFVLTLR
ncbi:hypothetical protein BV20DRAFT_566640 [Pilatotrama ljubarskyi]|nr:hypothetical protein BV20DRAFT_566640 [Pilatotrama ljubarskyi]